MKRWARGCGFPAQRHVITPPEPLIPSVDFALGALARSWRKAAGLKQAEVAELVGLSRAQVSCLEAGKYGWSVANVLKFAMVLNADPWVMLEMACNLYEGTEIDD